MTEQVSRVVHVALIALALTLSSWACAVALDQRGAEPGSQISTVAR